MGRRRVRSNSQGTLESSTNGQSVSSKVMDDTPSQKSKTRKSSPTPTGGEVKRTRSNTATSTELKESEIVAAKTKMKLKMEFHFNQFLMKINIYVRTCGTVDGYKKIFFNDSFGTIIFISLFYDWV